MVYDCLRSRVPIWAPSHCNDEAGPSVQPPLDEPTSGFQIDERSQLTDRFFNVLKIADQPLYEGCENHSQLSFVARMLSIKSDANMSEADFNSMITAIKEVLPPDNTMPTDYYHHRKTMNELGLPVVKIDACKNGCMLYWKHDATEVSCKFCDEPRYKQVKGRHRLPNDHAHKMIAQAILRYLPLTPRLQRLYASNATATHMTWHATHERNEGVMQHPSDAEAWEHFDRTYPDFAQEPRNIRLGLCADGFAPHGQFGRTYSCCPVVVTPYNLPPGMCMKRPYMFLTLICPGPKNPKKNIDVFLQPLIDELNNLWVFGEMTYDISKSEYFRMKAALLCTINDFPAYGMLSGWSTAGVLGCPICMESSNAFHLQHGRKASYFDCHRKFLPQNHSYRKDKKSFIRGRVEKNGTPPILSGDEILNRVMMFPTAVEDPINTPPGYGADHKWTKRSIFWDLPYWKTNLIRHNLDVMHIEKNVFDNVFFTVMDVKGKSKDNINARKDVGVLCDRKEIAVPSNSTCRSIPKALYTLTKAQKRVICEWIHQFKVSRWFL
ncbi:uncharacterized protein LOC120282765 [Dioscorea cayenensis subsp. rotundata]|uniref:Uncharacterized protein LOC120282765 n=1 Tax=Dioscorea cayennensis subsp. rotundata TaxID=55577 RepID=A0AB40D5N0_DIOCR|nr:uncharacterized protein LOC120282765 [Dioscorea cayenensis subsp. rotundata]